MDDAHRMNQIMQMDTRALLSTIKELESKLSQYQRQDSVPAWASTLLPRLDKLEADVRISNIAASMPGGGQEPQSREDAIRDDRLLSKIKAELNNHAESTGLAMEAKIAAMASEMERMHKLLQIRPTTSEYQKVMFIVNDQGSQMRHEIEDTQNRLLDVVHTSIAKEIDKIMNGIKSNEGLNDRSMDGIIRRVEQLSKDYYDLKLTSHADYEQVSADIRIVNVDIEGIKTTVASNEQKAKQSFSYINAQLEEHVEVAKDTRQSIADLTVELREEMRQQALSIKADHSELTHDVKRMSDRLEFQIKDVKIFTESLQQQLQELSVAAVLNHNQLSTVISEINDAIDSNRTKQNQVLQVLEKLHEFDATEKIGALKEQLIKTNSKLDALSHRAAEIAAHTGRVEEHSSGVNASLEAYREKSSEKFNEVYSAIEEAQAAIEIGSNDASMLNSALQDLKGTVTDLGKLRMEVDYVKTVNSGAVETVNLLQERVEGLDAMLRYVSDNATAAEKKATVKFEELAVKVQDALIESQAEFEAQVEQIHEQMQLSEAAAAEMGNRIALSSRSSKVGGERSSRLRSMASSTIQDSDEDSDTTKRSKPRESVASNNSGGGGRTSASRERTSSGGGRSSISGGGRSSISAKRKKSVQYPVDGIPASAPDPSAPTRSSGGSFAQMPPQSNSRGILHGTAGQSKGSEHVPPRRGMPPITDSGEFAKTPPQSREGGRPSLSESPGASNVQSPSKRVSNASSIAANPSNGPTTPGIQSDVQSAFFGGNSGPFETLNSSVDAQIEDSNGEPVSHAQSTSAPVAVTPALYETHNQYQSDQHVDGSQARLAESDVLPIQTKATSTFSSVAGGAGDNSSLGADSAHSSDSRFSKPASSGDRKPVTAGSVSVVSQPRQMSNTGFKNGNTGGAAGHSSGYRYEPNQSSVSLTTNTMLRPKSRAGSAHTDEPFEELAIHDLLDNAERVYELGLHFEEIAVRRSLVPDISEDTCSELAAIAISVGETISKLVDTEVILRILRARPDQPIYGDSFISNRRLRLIDELMQETLKHLEAANPEAGITRLDARDYFMRRVQKVLQLSLSKYDQVLVPTQSRAGKVKIPSCIACDRPLLEKVRQDMVSRQDKVGRSQIVPFGSMSQSLIENDDGSLYGEHEGGSLMSKSVDHIGAHHLGAMHGRAVGLPSSLPRQSSRGGVGALMKANPRDIGSKGSKPEQAYTLIGGFKMPNKKGLPTKFTDDRYLFAGPELDIKVAYSGEMDMDGSGAAGYVSSPSSKTGSVKGGTTSSSNNRRL